MGQSIGFGRIAFAICGVAALLFGATPHASAQQPLKKVTYLLPAPPFLVAFAPWMIAKTKGYYAQEGLDVDFQTARGGADVAKQVGAGNAAIGGAIGDTPLIVRPNGVPVKTVAILGGGSLFTLAFHRNRGISGPKDLKGKIVNVLAFQDTTYYAALGMLKSAGVDPNDVKFQAPGATAMWQLFAAGEADAMVSSPDLTVNVADAGAKDVEVDSMAKYFESTAQSIVASDEGIRENPDLIRKLVRATLRGMKDIMDDPKAAAAVFAKTLPPNAGTLSHTERSLALYNQLVYPGQSKLGFVDEGRLVSLQKFYLSQGIVKEAVPIRDTFTNQFID